MSRDTGNPFLGVGAFDDHQSVPPTPAAGSEPGGEEHVYLCTACGGDAYRPDTVTGRRQALRCAECHALVGRCQCSDWRDPAPTDWLDHADAALHDLNHEWHNAGPGGMTVGEFRARIDAMRAALAAIRRALAATPPSSVAERGGLREPNVEEDGELAVVMYDLLTELLGPHPDQGIAWRYSQRIHDLTAFTRVATPVAATLDAERLARALHAWWYAGRPLVVQGGGNLDEVLAADARIIAAEYDRLASEGGE